MKKKIIIFCFILQITLLSFSEDLPQPKNKQLYTEFTSYRNAKYLKKPLISSGIIVMDQEKFLFKQQKPFTLEIRKIEGKITLQRENAEPIQIDSSNISGNEIMFLFDDQQVIKEKFNIDIKLNNNKKTYTVIPKTQGKIGKILITAVEDKAEKIEILFFDNSSLIYEFKNTITGVKPDEKYFE